MHCVRGHLCFCAALSVAGGNVLFTAAAVLLKMQRLAMNVLYFKGGKKTEGGKKKGCFVTESGGHEVIIIPALQPLTERILEWRGKRTQHNVSVSRSRPVLRGALLTLEFFIYLFFNAGQPT